MTQAEYDEGERAWEAWMDQCETIWRKQGIGAYKACGCDTKTKATARYETKSMGGRPASTRPQPRRVTATKSGWSAFPETARMLRECKAQQPADDYVTRQLKMVQARTDELQDEQAQQIALARQEAARFRW